MGIKFVTPPRARKKEIIGNKNIGQIEIEIGAGITTDEAELIQEAIFQLETPYQKAATCAIAISDRETVKIDGEEPRQLSAVEAFGIVVDSINGKEIEDEQAKSIAIKYAKQIGKVSSYTARYSTLKKIATVTAVLKARNDESITEEEVRKLPSELTTMIFDAVNATELEDTDTDSAPPTEEDLGKQEEGG